MAKTRTQAIKAVLEDLGKLNRTSNVTTPDSDRVSDRYDAAVARLRNDDIIDIADPVNAIPEEAFNPLVAYLIQECAPAFHTERDEQKLKYAEAQIRSVDRNGRSVGDTVADRLATRVLRQLQVIDAGAAPSTREIAIVSERVFATLQELSQRNIIFIGDVEDLENVGAFDAVADYIAAEGFTAFKTEAQTSRLGPLSIIKRQDAERRLRRLGAGEPTFQPLVGSYF